MTLEALGEEVGVTHGTVSRYERGERTPSDEMLERIASALGISVQDIYEKADELDDTQSEPAHTRHNNGTTSNYVNATRHIPKWRDRVIRDVSVDEGLELLLMALPAFLDRMSWIIPITQEQYIRETGRSRDLVADRWEDMLESPYVERIGENEWTLRLRIPDK
jgi:transcriptional regulator with XRE-family HTH domain